MAKTLVIQSHRDPLPFAWIQPCLQSVSDWANQQGFDYRFLADEFFDPVPAALLQKTRQQLVIATDLARLIWLQRGLAEGFDRVIWCDADFLIFNAAAFEMPQSDYALGREVWVQRDQRQKIRAYSKVHNAFLMFRRGNSFLDFYRETAERLLHSMEGGMPPQFIGPKLLTALSNIALCPVMESAGMLSPLVIADIVKGEGKALDLFREKSPQPLAGANLSSSLTQSEGLSDVEMVALIERLLESAKV